MDQQVRAKAGIIVFLWGFSCLGGFRIEGFFSNEGLRVSNFRPENRQNGDTADRCLGNRTVFTARRLVPDKTQRL